MAAQQAQQLEQARQTQQMQQSEQVEQSELREQAWQTQQVEKREQAWQMPQAWEMQQMQQAWQTQQMQQTEQERQMQQMQQMQQARQMQQMQQSEQVERAQQARHLFRFHVMTDTHIEAEDEHLYNQHFKLALQDITEHFPDSACIAHVGDLTNHGFPAEYERYATIIDSFGDKLPPIYAVQGNHDVGTISLEELVKHVSDNEGLAGVSADLGLLEEVSRLRALPKEYADKLPPFHATQDEQGIDSSLWKLRIAEFLSATGCRTAYHHHVVEDAHFIFIGSESNDPLFCDLSREQLAWLENTLLAVPRTGLPIFLFLHQPLMDTVSGSRVHQKWYGVRQDEELKLILSKHPRVVLFTGHTHWELGSPYTYVPATASSPAMLNSASVAYLWTDEDERKEGSQGYVVDVYEDRTVVRGRDYRAGDWIDGVEYVIEQRGLD